MADLVAREGVLATAQGAGGVSANRVCIGWDTAALYIRIVPGGNTMQIEQSIDGGVTFTGPIWANNLTSGGVTTTQQTSSALFRIDYPSGVYQTNVTAFVSGSASAQYRIGPAFQE